MKNDPFKKKRKKRQVTATSEPNNTRKGSVFIINTSIPGDESWKNKVMEILFPLQPELTEREKLIKKVALKLRGKNGTVSR